MPEEKSKTVKFEKESIEKLPNDKPAVYKILGENDKNIYTGSAKRNRVRERIEEHLPGGLDPIHGGSKVQIEQKKAISDAEQSEKRIIARSKPKYNIKGKPSK
jgi:excinuclease UvrABC nuclease subunit